jgi:toxin FitB
LYVLDTSVVSSILRDEPGPALEWVSGQELAALYLASTVVYETARGILRMPPSRRRERLSLLWDQRLMPMFAGRALALDAPAARVWAQITVTAERRGRTPPLLDSQIAAAAVARGMTVVTLDRRGFGELGCGLLVLA